MDIMNIRISACLVLLHTASYQAAQKQIVALIKTLGLQSICRNCVALNKTLEVDTAPCLGVRMGLHLCQT